MRVERVVGTETEYAILDECGSGSNPTCLSAALVRVAGIPALSHIRWDYGLEDPVNDARGGRLPRSLADPSILTDSPQAALTNILAPNGGRIYVDHAHPEYSSPETIDPFQALAYDRAGDLLMARASQEADLEGRGRLRLYKNNVDGKGASWGTHENYLMDRAVPFDQVAALMTIHFVTRQIYTGSGRVGLGVESQEEGYQLGQRADYLCSPLGLQTTFDRPIINTRDESHSTASTRRFHVIVGDANRMDVPQVLKIGTTSMLLGLLEDAQEAGYDLDSLVKRLALANPVQAMRVVSRDLSLGEGLELSNGRRASALEIQGSLYQAVCQAGRGMYGSDRGGRPDWPDQTTSALMNLWGQVLEDLELVQDADEDRRMAMDAQAGRLEWLLKWQLLENLRRRRSIRTWGDPRLTALDIEWARLEPGHDLPSQLSSRMQKEVSLSTIQESRDQGPTGTRAWLRSFLLHSCPEAVRFMSWSRVILASPQDDEQEKIFTVDLSDPLRHTRADCMELLEHYEDIPTWLNRWEG